MIRVAAAAALLLALAGCTAASPDLDVLTDADAPDGMTWTPSGAELTAGEDLERFEHAWEDAAGAPDECLPLYLLAYGVRPDDAGSDDRTVELGYFTLRQGPGAIMVNAREFDSEEEAADFVDHARASALSCAGYVVGGLEVAPNGFAVDPFESGDGVVVDAGDGQVAARFTVVRHARTIVVVDAFFPERPLGLGLGVVDEIASSVLDRLDARS